ncbi:MAG: DUF1800 domain-containing protein [Phycisphaerae bacterium]|nr:DUF1800 domain-containing protein [Phycisphaerae bacterium]
MASDGSADIDPNSLLTRLVRRITMGLNSPELSLAKSLGFQGYIDYHLNPVMIDDSAMDLRLASFTTLGMTYPQMVTFNNSGLVENELIEATILRARYSRRQLLERMVEFWTDHFSINIASLQQAKAIHDRDIVRVHALGSFPTLLTLTAQSPAMLIYLGNFDSVAGNPNENFARELLELHTMGVGGGYTQFDVEEIARCFTGWTFYPDNAGPLAGSFRYSAQFHDQGTKHVLGHVIPPGGGLADGFTVLNILSAHPSTASFIARKICTWLLGEQTPMGVIESVKAAYLSSNGDIRSMIRVALRPEHLADALPRFKRPFHLFISAMRALSCSITSVGALRTQLRMNGHYPFYWPAPDGYPDEASYWNGLMLPRWNFGALLTNGNITGASVDHQAFFLGAASAEAMADRIDQMMFGGEMPIAERNLIRNALLPEGIGSSARQRDALGLAVSAPSFQWY